MIFLCFELREKYLDVIFLLGSAWFFLKKITPQKIWLLDLRALIISMDMNKVLKLPGPSSGDRAPPSFQAEWQVGLVGKGPSSA